MEIERSPVSFQITDYNSKWKIVTISSRFWKAILVGRAQARGLFEFALAARSRAEGIGMQ